MAHEVDSDAKRLAGDAGSRQFLLVFFITAKLWLLNVHFPPSTEYFCEKYESS